VGVSVTRITPALQRALGLGSDHGALVQDVTPDSAAERAGLRPYDVITSADAVEIRSDDDLIRHITARAPGTISSFQLLRGDVAQTVSVKLSDRPVPAAALGRFRKTGVQPAAGREQGPLGFLVRDLDPASALRKALPDVIQGVLVADVDAAGPARIAHLRPGQLVLELNRRPTPTAQTFQAALASLPPGTAAALLIYDPITEQRLLVSISPDRYE
jgi:serine protease Do